MAVCGVEAPAADGAALGDDRPVQRSTGYDDPGFHLDPSPTRHPSRGRRPPAPTTRRPAGSHDRHRGGRPGGSAHAEYQRHRAREHASWAHTRPWWVTASLGAGLVTLVAATLLNLPLPRGPR